MILYEELGLIFIYIFAYGISEYIVKKYIITDTSYLLYYICIGLIGMFILGVSTLQTMEQIPMHIS